MEQHKTTLRDLREQNGMTRADVAAALGVTPNAITNYERGNRRLALEHILILAKIYEASAEDIIMAQLNSCPKVLKDNLT